MRLRRLAASGRVVSGGVCRTASFGTVANYLHFYDSISFTF